MDPKPRSSALLEMKVVNGDTSQNFKTLRGIVYVLCFDGDGPGRLTKSTGRRCCIFETSGKDSDLAKTSFLNL